MRNTTAATSNVLIIGTPPSIGASALCGHRPRMDASSTVGRVGGCSAAGHHSGVSRNALASVPSATAVCGGESPCDRLVVPGNSLRKFRIHWRSEDHRHVEHHGG